MSFATPLGLLALLGVPAVLYLHLFRRRLRERSVAGLFLFAPDTLAISAGRKRSRLLRTPSLWLELAAALFLGLWLGGLRFGAGTEAVHLVAVLDDSASMGAKGIEDTAVDEARIELLEMVSELPGSSVATLILTGPRPEILLGPRAPVGLVEQALERWQPRRPRHDFSSSLDLAQELGGAGGSLVLFTDEDVTSTPPVFELRAVGGALPNAAVIGARRVPEGDGERIYGEVLAWGNADVQTELLISAGSDGEVRELARRAVTIPRDRPLHVSFEIPSTALPITISISDDALELDNTIRLLPELRKLLPVASYLDEEESVRLRLDKAFDVLPSVETGSVAPRLVFARGPGQLIAGQVEVVVHAPGNERDDWVGPFLVERRHALLRGITLEGVVWSAASTAMPGRALILAGEQSLLSEEESPAGTRFHLNLDSSRSNLPASPDWPILLSNLVEYARERLPGASAHNVRLGELMTWRHGGTAEEAAELGLLDPQGLRLPARGLRILTWEARRPGIHRLMQGRAGGEVASFAVHFSDPRESDLTGRSRVRREALPALADEDIAAADIAPLEGRILALLLLLAVVTDWWVLQRGGRWS